MNDFDTKNITFRTYNIYNTALERAAAKAGKNLSDYVRDIVVPWAYSDLGERMPQLPKIERGRYSSMIAQAAKASGMTREQFTEEAAKQLAAKLLSESGEHAVVRQAPARPERPNGRYSKSG